MIHLHEHPASWQASAANNPSCVLLSQAVFCFQLLAQSVPALCHRMVEMVTVMM